MQVRDIMHTGERLPVVTTDNVFRELLEEMDAKGRGAVCVADSDGRLAGLVTDGDIRRLLLSTQKTLPELFMENVERIMTADPKRIDADVSAEEALAQLERFEFWVLPVVEGDRLVGLLHMHTLMKALLEAGR